MSYSNNRLKESAKTLTIKFTVGRKTMTDLALLSGKKNETNIYLILIRQLSEINVYVCFENSIIMNNTYL